MDAVLRLATRLSSSLSLPPPADILCPLSRIHDHFYADPHVLPRGLSTESHTHRRRSVFQGHLRLRMSESQSDDKVRGNQSRDTTTDDVLVVRPGVTDPLLTSREGVRTRRLPMRYGKTSCISLILFFLKTVTLPNRLRGPAQQRKTSSLKRRRRGCAPRGKLRRRNQCCLPTCMRFTTHIGKQRVSF